ncbi:MAG: hypothetical protein E3J47_08255 [Candidatus Stahlbacteria bacterium]|nr:MAG: hypothetical protein E3J47_08255 [Candidatus Stahlbacteria bacterium]
MLVIREEKRPHYSEECTKCVDDFSIMGSYAGYVDVCTDCEDAVETTFKCPGCKTSNSFFGTGDPGYCSSCQRLLPDIINLKISDQKRIRYHNRGGCS